MKTYFKLSLRQRSALIVAFLFFLTACSKQEDVSENKIVNNTSEDLLIEIDGDIQNLPSKCELPFSTDRKCSTIKVSLPSSTKTNSSSVELLHKEFCNKKVIEFNNSDILNVELLNQANVGAITFFTNETLLNRNVKVLLGNKYEGYITGQKPYTGDICKAEGLAYFEVPEGKYIYEATSGGLSWTDTVRVKKNDCILLELKN